MQKSHSSSHGNCNTSRGQSCQWAVRAPEGRCTRGIRGKWREEAKGNEGKARRETVGRRGGNNVQNGVIGVMPRSDRWPSTPEGGRGDGTFSCLGNSGAIMAVHYL